MNNPIIATILNNETDRGLGRGKKIIPRERTMGLKWRRGRGRGGFSLLLPLPSSSSLFSTCFQNGSLSDR